MLAKKSIYTLLIVLFLSNFLAFLVANSSDKIKVRNDISSYKSFYNCLEYDINSIHKCNTLIGTQNDILFQSFSYVGKNILKFNFKFFLYVLVFSIFFSILFTVYKSSIYPSISILFLLSDYRFWEYGANTLRAGIAIAIMLISFYLYLQKQNILTSFFKFLPSFAHITAFFYILVPFNHIKSKKLILLFLLAIIFSYNFHIIFELSKILPNTLFDKIYFYYNQNLINKVPFGIPMQYLAIILFGFYLYITNQVKDKIFIFSFNIIIIALLLFISLIPLGMSYRYSYYMLPFLAIVLSFEVDYIMNICKFKSYKGMVVSISYLAILFILWHDLKVILLKI